MEIKKILEINELLDIYGDLLTVKQRQVMNLYYEEDLSLGEISEELNVSRQAVYDTAKKSEQLLYSYEKSLGVRNTGLKNKNFKEKLIAYLISFEDKYSNSLTQDELIDIKKITEFCKESLI
ncbi:hypothetical protein HMPREF9630_02027 [Peptoanaerobacter stomatis]|uniref:UPF0122 protein HMPREF9630_02027 n=1 Tax=Peptoanaerobacter stomatis TaxID=796937 RepID=V9HTY7_9FIRM|nr:sigma factor-like helix-turn-helix DNA-binding protein [Peptoanaerobacter stomatis]EHL15675.1 hypothetical protein HMPREF9630_02027 [Peptoanaerobacter stomatis]